MRFPPFRSAAFAVMLAALLGGFFVRPARAIPSFSLRYNVPCTTCHTVAPRLNPFGLAFQANYFNWPDLKAPQRESGPKAVPISAIVTVSRESGQGIDSSTKLRAVELYPSDGFTVHNGTRAGGYFADLFPITTSEEDRAGNVEEAYVALPFAGPRGEWSVLVGQSTPLMYQYDPVNSLTDNLPGAYTLGANVFSPASPVPMARVDFFNHRTRGTSDGVYASFGVPFGGSLALDRRARLYEGQGGFVQTFVRKGADSVGVIGFANGGNRLLTATATEAIARERVYLTAAGTIGRVDGEKPKRASLEAEYDVNPFLAVTGRMEFGEYKPYPVGAITFYPFNQNILRLTIESASPTGARTFTIFGRGQF